MQTRQLDPSKRQALQATYALPGAGIILIGFLTLLSLVVVAERTGLPPSLAEKWIFLLMFLLCAGLIFIGQTAEEYAFTRRNPLMQPMISGIVAGAVLTGLGIALLRPATAGPFATILTGQMIGILLAHVLARWQWQKSERHAEGTRVQAVLQGILQATAGGVLGLICLSLIADDLAAAMAVQGTAPSLLSVSLLLVLLPLLAVTFGGLRASLALVFGLVVLASAGIAATLATGLLSLGALPLPSFSEGATLAAIVEAKARWFTTPVHPVVLTQWPAPAAIFSSQTALLLLGSACISCFVMLSVFPASHLRRRSILAPTLASGIVFPLCLVAASGYAIEAAGFQFVGASVQRPPSGLLEAARNGFVTVCNAAPLTVDALRAACGVSPRDAMLLDWQQVQISRSFLSGGLLSAMGYPVAMGVLARAAESLLLLTGLTAGFWIAARGLGLGVFSRNRMAPGLASLRLGFVRLAALLLAAVLVPSVTWLDIPAGLLWQIAAVAAGLGLALTIVSHWRAAEGVTPSQPILALNSSVKKTVVSAACETV